MATMNRANDGSIMPAKSHRSTRERLEPTQSEQRLHAGLEQAQAIGLPETLGAEGAWRCRP